MWKKLKRWSAMLLAAFLVIGSVEYSGLVAKAAETEDITVTMAELTEKSVSNASKVADTKTGGATFTYNTQYGVVYYKVPSDVDASKVTKISFDNASGNYIITKVFSQEGYDSDKTANPTGTAGMHAWDASGFDISDFVPAYIAIASSMAIDETNTSNSIYMDSISFTVNDNGTETVKTYSIKDLGTPAAGWNYTTAFDEKVGGVTYSFTDPAGAIYYELPSNVDATKLKKVTFNNPQGTGYIMFKLFSEAGYTAGTSSVDNYGDGVLDVSTTDIKYLSVCTNDSSASADAPRSFSVDSVTFTVEKSTTSEGGDDEGTTLPANTYTFTGWTESSTSGNITTTVDATTGAATFASTSTFTQMFYKIPAEIDATKLEKVVLNDVSGDTGNIFLRLLTEDQFTNSIWSEQVAAEYGKTEIATGGSTEVAYLMIGVQVADASVTVGSVTFVVSESSSGNETGDTTTEADLKLTISGGSDLVTSWSNKTPEMKLTAKYNSEVKFSLEKALSWADFQSATFSITGATSDTVALKLYQGSTAIAVVYGKLDSNNDFVVKNTDTDGNVDYTTVTEIDAVAVMRDCDPTDAEATVNFTGVAFSMKNGDTEYSKTFNVFADAKEDSDTTTTTEKTYTFNELTEDSNSGDITVTVDATTGSANFVTAGTYKQVFYKVPEELRATLQKVVLNDVTGDADQIFLRLLTEEDYANKWSQQTAATYGSTEISTDGAANIAYLVIGGQAADANITVGSVSFVVTGSSGDGTGGEGTGGDGTGGEGTGGEGTGGEGTGGEGTGGEGTGGEGTGGESTEPEVETQSLQYDSATTMTAVKSDAGVEFEFAENNQELKFTLGKKIGLNTISNAAFGITGLTEGQKLALKLYDESGNLLAVKYDLTDSFVISSADIATHNNGTIPTTEVAAIGIMANVEGAAGSAVFTGIKIEVVGAGSTSQSYTAYEAAVADNAGTLSQNYAYGGISYDTTVTDGTLVITAQWADQQLQMKPSKSVTLDDYSSVTFNIAEEGFTGSFDFIIGEYANSAGHEYWKSADAANDQVITAGGSYTYDISAATGNIGYFVFNSKDAATMTVNSVVLTKADGSTMTFTMPITRTDVYTVSSGTATIANGQMSTSLAANYGGSTFLAFPSAIDPTDWQVMTVEVVAATATTEVRIVDAATEWADAGLGTFTFDAAGTQTIDMSTVTGPFTKFRLIATTENASDVTIGAITFSKISTVDYNTFEDVPDAPYTPVDGAYTFAEMPYTGGDATPTVDENGRLTVSLTKQYGQIAVEIPADIDPALIEKVIFNGVSGEGYAFKLIDEAGLATFAELVVAYGSTEVSTASLTAEQKAAIKYLGIMTTAAATEAAPVVLSIDSVTFELADPNAEPEQTYTVEMGANDLTLDSAGATTTTLENSAWVIDCSTSDSLYQEAKFLLPQQIDMSNCKSITFTLDDTVGPFSFKLYSNGSAIATFYYHNGAGEYRKVAGVDFDGLTAKIDTIGIMNSGDDLNGDGTYEEYVEGAKAILSKVTFEMLGTEPLAKPADDSYTPEYLEEVDPAGGASSTEVLVEGTVVVEHIQLPTEGSYVTFALPEHIDVDHLTQLDVVASFIEGAAGDVEFQMLDASGNVVLSGTDLSIATKCTPDLKFLRIVSKKADGPVTMNLFSLDATIDPNAFYSIVINGSFEKDDVSMWSGAAWGETTTLMQMTSETPIFGSTYTYGEIDGRTSPYECFAQDITKRVKPGTTYTFEFRAMLSEDYEGAPANQREVQFSPYWIDANGTEQYGLVPDGVYKQSLTPGVWTHFQGEVTVPAGATGFVIRIVEQGTNYGQGVCVLGKYAVTGVKMEEVIPEPEEPNWYNPEAPVSMNYTTLTFGADQLKIDWASAEASKTDDSIKALYGSNYSEVRMKLPYSIDMSQCETITVKFKGQNVPVAIKLIKGSEQVLVNYYNTFQPQYTFKPYYDGKINKFSIMSLCTPNPEGAFAEIESITFVMYGDYQTPNLMAGGIVLDPAFQDEELSDWREAIWGEGVTMTSVTSPTPIYDDVYTYGEISRRTSPYECFSQDITGRVVQDGMYTVSFWAKLSDDYKGAPENQRVVQFSPYTVDSDGVADYNPQLEGTYAQTLTPGVWTYFECVWKVTNPVDVASVFIRIIEQGTNYGQGDCVLGSYAVTGVQIEEYIPEPPSIDEEVPDLKAALTEEFGEDFIVGTAVTGNEFDDLGVEMLANKHFNAITLGNELKPDALFGYSNSQHTELKTIDFNGQSLQVPTLNFRNADAKLKTIKEWNATHPDEQIKVRGHVLVWHSQTPEWFFREGYVVGQNADGSENYVTPEVMNLRLEWYIKTVLEHYVGEDSEYKDLFYGWDVVNEAVGDGTGTYRTNTVTALESPSADTHGSNSSWWAVYESNEFVIKAFQYANKYAPAELELYYNDYNECDTRKVQGITKLLTDVLAAEGTRIDAMGMQAHYSLFNPGMGALERAIRSYAAVVGKVQLTELDLKASDYIGTDDSLAREYAKQAEHYKKMHDLLLKLDAEEGIEIGGVTFWGTVDKYSWLQTKSNVGGGADGEATHCPLLFDDNYKVKPAYWAWVDYTMVDPDYVAEEGTTTTPSTPADDENAEGSEGSSESNEIIENTTTVTVTVPGDEKGSSVAPIVAGVAGAVVVAGAGVGAVLLKKKKGLPKADNTKK